MPDTVVKNAKPYDATCTGPQIMQIANHFACCKVELEALYHRLYMPGMGAHNEGFAAGVVPVWRGIIAFKCKVDRIRPRVRIERICGVEYYL